MLGAKSKPLYCYFTDMHFSGRVHRICALLIHEESGLESSRGNTFVQNAWPFWGLDTATFFLWGLGYQFTEYAMMHPSPAWACVPLAAEALLLWSLWHMRRLGEPDWFAQTRVGDKGLGIMTLQLFVACFALGLPFMTTAWLGSLAGITDGGAFVDAGWAMPLLLLLLSLSVIYPAMLVRSVISPPTEGSQWGDTKRVFRLEFLNAVAVNIHMVLSAGWIEMSSEYRNHGSDTESAVTIASITLIMAVPRFVFSVNHFNRGAVLSISVLLLLELSLLFTG